MPAGRPHLHQGFSWAVRDAHARDEQERERLFAAHHSEEEHADADGLYPPNACWTRDNPSPPNPHKDLPIYQTIHRIRRDIIESIVYCLLVNRTQFLYEQSVATHHQTVNLSRAILCEILAEKILRRFNEHNPGPKGLLLLANILVAGFEPFQNTPEEVIHENPHALNWAVSSKKKDATTQRKLTSLEVAIISESKSFLASTACKKVVDAIYLGRLVYTPSSFIDIIPDRWKYKPISLYDPRRAPLLNQYRLIVPRTRNAIEVGQFVILLFLYVVIMSGREERQKTDYTTWELLFDIYGAGWVLDQIASVLEHGWKVYSQNLWSFLDTTFMIIFVTYLVIRMHALTLPDAEQSILLSRTALDILSCGAPILIPRLAFNIMSENMLFVSLRAMMSDFLTLTALAVWCFAGFLLSMKWLHNGAHSPVTISKWMVWIWFGLDGTGIQRSPDFHWILGPALMILFAFLGNTLFLTILVSMLSNTFSLIAANATAEIQFRRAVLTFEGVKSDAIFAYMPPFNILALAIMLPLKFTVSERMFHKVNAMATRTLNAPLLLLISLYERHTLWRDDRHRRRPGSPGQGIAWKRHGGPTFAPLAITKSIWNFTRFKVHGDIQAVFETEPPQNLLEDIAEEDDVHEEDATGRTLHAALEDQFPGLHTPARRESSSRSPRRPGNKAKGKPAPGTAAARSRSSGSDRLRVTFGSPSDESAQSRESKSKKRPARMDSIVDFNADGSAMDEANERLHKLEESVARIEEMLASVLEQRDPGDGDGEGGADSDVDASLNRELQTGIHE